MMLDRLVFDCVRSLPFMVTVGCGRAKASVRPHISDDVAMHVLVKWCRMSKGGCPGDWILSVLMYWIHALIGIEWSYDVRRAHVLLWEIFTINCNGWMWEGQGICLPTYI